MPRSGAVRKPSPVAAGRLLGKIKEEAARPGDICARGLAAAAGPSRSRLSKTEPRPDPQRRLGNPNAGARTHAICSGPCNKTAHVRGKKKPKKSPWFAPGALQRLAERTGLEPATSGVTGQHSNQLNYRSALETLQALILSEDIQKTYPEDCFFRGFFKTGGADGT